MGRRSCVSGSNRSGLTRDPSAEPGSGTALATPFEPRAIFAAARGGDVIAREVVAELARRIALHVVPIGAVADVELVVLGGGLGRNGDLLLEPIRRLLGGRLPYPPPRRGLDGRRRRGARGGALRRPLRGARQRLRRAQEVFSVLM